MFETLEGKKCLASIALFRELTNSNYDIYSTLAEFIKLAIYENKIQQFTLVDIKKYLSEMFGFLVPESVIRNSIKRIPEVQLTDRQYYLKKHINVSEKLDERKDELEKYSNQIIDKIKVYIENKIGRSLTSVEEENVFDSICIFLLDEKSIQNNFTKYVSAFIVENSKNQEIIKCLNTIKEGVLLYAGLQYTPEEFSSNVWDTELVLYFDTEILFSLYGYNGELYKLVTQELIELIEKINKRSIKKNTKKIIELKFFEAIENEINGIF